MQNGCHKLMSVNCNSSLNINIVLPVKSVTHACSIDWVDEPG